MRLAFLDPERQPSTLVELIWAETMRRRMATAMPRATIIPPPTAAPTIAPALWLVAGAPIPAAAAAARAAGL